MKITLALATMMVALVGAPALAEDGRVSQSMLAAMGLGGMEQLSDSQGKEVRGEGLMLLHSFSSARIGTNPLSSETAHFQGSTGWQVETGAAVDNAISISLGQLNLSILQSQTASGYARGRAW